MRRTLILTPVLMGLAIATGCGPEKELPKDIPDSPDRTALPVDPIPTTSHPDAVQLVERCIRAATDGHPERLDKLKVIRQSGNGQYRGVSGEFGPAGRSIEAVWPDRARVTYDYSVGDIKQFLIGLRRPTIWAYNVYPTGPVKFETPSPKEYEQIITVDVIGQLWLPLLVPLTDSKTIVFGVKKEMIGDQTADAVKVAIPDCPVYTLFLNEKTNLPGMITYTHKEWITTFQKRIMLSGDKMYGGAKLPTRLEYSRNGVAVEEWSVTAYEFPDKIDDIAFEPPPEKK
jgi:hypothetical protein